eukprot:4359071-Ditylum_brightwellii.AAC.1
MQSVDTTLGGGANSHLGLVCDATTYAGIPGGSNICAPTKYRTVDCNSYINTSTNCSTTRPT